MNENPRFIHLLYVPTLSCNMGCAYCYLDGRTVDHVGESPLKTLTYAVDKLSNSNVMPFNISLHGGEVTTLRPDDFEALICWIDEYYRINGDMISAAGFKLGRPHIKTNLLALDRHIETIKRYQVSVSGSLDLPFSLHRKYRRDKAGKDTLDRILANIELMRGIDNRKKVSATIFKEHFERLDEMCADIRYLHENTCLDMNDFNFMIGFKVPGSPMTALSEQEQVLLFERMHREFEGTELERGLREAWFAEFTQSYCTNCDVCGDKFFLLERTGDVFSCVRGQGDKDFYYGNIYTDSVEDILQRGHERIYALHAQAGFDPACGACKHLSLCKTGCPYVKKLYKSARSYTCLLQQEIYKQNAEPDDPEGFPHAYTLRMHPLEAPRYLPPAREDDGLPSLDSLIAADKALQSLYDPEAFIFRAEGQAYPLSSQLLKRTRTFITILPGMKLEVDVRRDVFDAQSRWPVNNALYMMLLSGDTVVYGDEGREKQAHVMSHMIYRDVCLRNPADDPAYCRVDLTDILAPYLDYLSHDKPNNLFFTTSDLREVHYAKQKNNGYYHLRAMNLPFQNIEFYVPELPEKLKRMMGGFKK